MSPKPDKPKKQSADLQPPKEDTRPKFDPTAATEFDPSGRTLPREVLIHRPGEKPTVGTLRMVSRTDHNMGALVEDEEGEELVDVPSWNGKAPQPAFVVWTEAKGGGKKDDSGGGGAGAAKP